MEEEKKKETLQREQVKQGPNGATPDPAAPSDLGLDPKLAAALCYVPFISLVVSIVVILIEKKNNFIRFHAGQALGIVALQFIVSFVAGIFMVVPCLGGILLPVVMLGFFILQLVMAYKAYQGEYYKLPKLGDFVEKTLKL